MPLTYSASCLAGILILTSLNRIRTVSRPALLLRRIAPPVWYDGMPEHTGRFPKTPDAFTRPAVEKLHHHSLFGCRGAELNRPCTAYEAA